MAHLTRNTSFSSVRLGGFQCARGAAITPSDSGKEVTFVRDHQAGAHTFFPKDQPMVPTLTERSRSPGHNLNPLPAVNSVLTYKRLLRPLRSLPPPSPHKPRFGAVLSRHRGPHSHPVVTRPAPAAPDGPVRVLGERFWVCTQNTGPPLQPHHGPRHQLVFLSLFQRSLQLSSHRELALLVEFTAQRTGDSTSLLSYFLVFRGDVVVLFLRVLPFKAPH